MSRGSLPKDMRLADPSVAGVDYQIDLLLLCLRSAGSDRFRTVGEELTAIGAISDFYYPLKTLDPHDMNVSSGHGCRQADGISVCIELPARYRILSEKSPHKAGYG